MKPTVGRVVLYSAPDGSALCAAIIVHVWSDQCINVAWFTPNGEAKSATSVLLLEGEGPVLGRWSWPPRV